jgi:hypothetical protein
MEVAFGLRPLGRDQTRFRRVKRSRDDRSFPAFVFFLGMDSRSHPGWSLSKCPIE